MPEPSESNNTNRQRTPEPATTPDLGGGLLPSTPRTDRRIKRLSRSRASTSACTEPYPRLQDASSRIYTDKDGSPQQVDTVAGNPGFFDEVSPLTKSAGVLLWNITIHKDDVAHIPKGYSHNPTWYKLKKKSIIDWRNQWQHKLWSSDFFLKFVEMNVKPYTARKRMTDPAYNANFLSLSLFLRFFEEDERDENRYLVPKAMVYYFRNMTITKDNIAEILKPHAHSGYKFDSKEGYITAWVQNWQNRIWGSTYFADFVQANVSRHGRERPVGAPSYDDLPNLAKSQFWQHESRWTMATLMEIFGTLDRGVNLHAVWESDEWRQYATGIYTVACISTYKYRLKLDDEGKPLDDRLQVYKNIRSAPDYFFSKWPAVSEVPTGANPSSRNPRDLREADLDDIELP
ncbi:hypothetical protein H2199_004818 [Coniosporium tulheliwenetii]|uniref:Uncharacterized protein n=1 Tax=Coniosporium tulheliwenetii TaxID=3383036 RepID=A0ACC2Z5E5_9PEZI|nr:hypothetical protein H2199_004818 [Cladosporium sp. JES 115]